MRAEDEVQVWTVYILTVVVSLFVGYMLGLL